MFSLVTIVPIPFILVNLGSLFVDTYQSFVSLVIVSLAEQLLASGFRIPSAFRSPLILEIFSLNYASIKGFIRLRLLAQPSCILILFWLLDNWTQINA